MVLYFYRITEFHRKDLFIFFINKELYFLSQLLKYYMLHGLIYKFLKSIWDFKNKWEMCWMFHFIQVKLASS